MNAEGFKGKAVRGCATLKAGVRVTTANEEDSERPAGANGVVKIHVVQGRRLRIGYTLTDERSFAEAELLNAARRTGYRAGVRSGPRPSPPGAPPPSDPRALEDSSA
jgi:hypothetical protein